MRFSARQLRAFAPTAPADERSLRQLLERLGLEVRSREAVDGDTLYTFDLLANRGDQRSYLGVARELAAATNGEVLFPDAAEVSYAGVSVPVTVLASDCLAYAVAEVAVDVGEVLLPADVLYRLDVAEMRVDDGVVDATGAVTLELGQPMHAFDRDTIDGGIKVRDSRPGESAWLLHEDAPRQLPAGTLVIADASKILAIAGVIGCRESCVTARTTRLLLESATFHPVAVRRASSALGVKTAASMRFERGGDPGLIRGGIERCARLLGSDGATAFVAKDWHEAPHTISFGGAEAVNGFFETSLGDDEIERILEHAGFVVEAPGVVRVPTWRVWDVEEPADVYEEVARFFDYDALPSTLPPVGLGSAVEPDEATRALIDEVLLGAGFYETITDGFYGADLLRQLGDDALALPHVRVLNSVEKQFSHLKRIALGHAVESVALGRRFGQPDVKLFEWTRLFVPDAAAENGVCVEEEILWAIASGVEEPSRWDGVRPADVFFLKGVVEEIAAELSQKLEFERPRGEWTVDAFLHPNRRLAILSGGVRIGALGEVRQDVLRRFGVKHGRATYLESARAPLVPAGRPEGDPRLDMTLERMLTLELRAPLESREVMRALREVVPPRVADVDIASVFESEEIGQGWRAVTFRLRFDATESRSRAEINDALAQAANTVEQWFGDSVRQQKR